MRFLVLLVTLLGTVAAQAQTNVYYVERGRWLVALIGTACRAYNRPAEDFNAVPYNALSIVARRGQEIGIEAFFWPGAIDPNATHRLQLSFGSEEPLRIDATVGMGDFALVSAAEPKLWRLLRDGDLLRVGVENKPELQLFFGLDGIEWVLDSLTECTGLLPKG